MIDRCHFKRNIEQKIHELAIFGNKKQKQTIHVHKIGYYSKSLNINNIMTEYLNIIYYYNTILPLPLRFFHLLQ